jgi:DNA-binding NarL/FixJ family response regulator
MDGENMFPDTNPDSKSNTLLSKQERRILKLIAEGHTSTKIAAELNISSLTVKAHRRNMMRKLGVDNSAALISTAFAKGLL